MSDYLGAPRFQVRELEGFAKSGVGSGASVGLCVTVIDRAYCCAMVARFVTEDRSLGPMSYDARRAHVRVRAVTCCAELNAK